METVSQIDNSIYDQYGDRWYTAYDDPVALLRAENEVKFPWILKKIRNFSESSLSVLDVGCGGGFLSNELARQGLRVTGIDMSPESLKIAQKYDTTQTVKYEIGDARQLPYESNSFDVVSAMDFLEHIDRPDVVIKELSRVLKPGGLFFFHTFNRNIISWFVVIKLLEWFVKNTPKNMHVLNYFIRPCELENYCRESEMKVLEMTGIRPVLTSIDWKMLRTGIVSSDMKFKLTKNTLLSYMGVAQKKWGASAPTSF